VVTVSFTHLGAAECPWPEHTRRLDLRPVDVARAAATTLAGVRDSVRMAAVALTVLGHLNEDLTPRGLDELDATARAEVVQRISVGLTRLAAEQGPTRTVDLFNLDALAGGPGVRVARRPGARRQPDFAGMNAVRLWSVFAARGRTGIGSPLATRRKAPIAALQDIEPWTRISCVARLRPEGTEVFADAPPQAAPANTYTLEVEPLVRAYYGFEDLELRGDWAWLTLAPRLELGVHRRLLELRDDVEALLDARLELQGQFEAERAGRDGLCLVFG
jgi:hypothetical protein